MDGENYFRAFYQSAAKARRHVLIAGWQFDLETRLVRGREARDPDLPVSFWSFLRTLCERREGLHVYVLAWDHSLVYTLEREWWQSARAKLNGHPRIRLEFRAHPDTIGSHHQKLVIIDDEVAFLGGIDFCESRWDTRQHRAHEEDRQNIAGLSSKPYHDIQAALTGPVVGDLTELFQAAWQEALGEKLELAPRSAADPPRRDLAALFDTERLSLPQEGMVLCRTLPRSSTSPEIREIQRTHEHLIRNAERLIYIEAQYFTSSAIGNALRERMTDASRPKLAIIIVMPHEAESPKERFVLGGHQNRVLSSLRSAAARHGHELRILSVTWQDEKGDRVSTFIHSKLMIVDDRAATFGSANITNRSMSFDSELNLAWNLEAPREPVPSLRELRASLMAEHSGRDPDFFRDPSTLIQKLDEGRHDPTFKLRPRELDAAPANDSLWTAVFDPSTELWVRHRADLKAYARDAQQKNVLQRMYWTLRLALRLAGAFGGARRGSVGSAPAAVVETPPSAASAASARSLGLKFLIGLVALYATVLILGKMFAEPLRELGGTLTDALGLPGFALGTFLADGLHFPVPPQLYMLMTIVDEHPAMPALASITAGSILGGLFGYVAALRFSHLRFIERRFSRLQLLAFTKHMQQHPYRWVAIASLTPIAFSWLCYLAGFYRFPRRALLLLCLLRVPKILAYFAIVRAGWLQVLP